MSIETVGDLQQLVQTRIDARQSGKCYTLPAFLEIRQLLRDATGDPALRIRPATLVVACLSSSERKVVWHELRARYGLFIDLERPSWLKRALVAVSLVLCVSGVYCDWQAIEAFPLGTLSGVLFAIALVVMSRPMCNRPSARHATIGQLATNLVGTRVARGDVDDLTAQQLEAEIRDIIVDAVGVDADEVVASARLREDLDIG